MTMRLDGDSQLKPVERLRLEEILDMCADYERQIEEEQKANRVVVVAEDDAGPMQTKTPEETNGTRRNNLNILFSSQSSHLFYPSSPTHTLQLSPGGSLLMPNRIKTNGSLPREARLGSPQPQTPSYIPSQNVDDDLNGIFAFLPHEGSKLSANNPKSDYDFDHETFMTQSLNGNLWPQSPRSKVRSIPLNNGNGLMSMSVDRGTLQGGGEDFFSATQTDEESKDDLLESLLQPTKSSPSGKKKPPPVPVRKSKLSATANVPDVNYSNTTTTGNPFALRKPPRSKHDSNTMSNISNDVQNLDRVDHYFPSSEAAHRVLIGTLMLQSGIYSKSLSSKSTSSLLSSSLKLSGRSTLSASNVRTAEMTQGSANEGDKTSLNKVDFLKSQRHRQVQLVSSIKMRLSDIETKVTEDIKQLELEHSLLAGEFDTERDKLKRIESKLSHLRIKESRQSNVFEEWQKVTRAKMEIAKRSVDEAEIKLERLDFEHSKFLSSISDEYRDDPERFVEEESKLLDSIKDQHDVIETARKAYEDLEFQHMEEITHREAEREELLLEISELEKLSSRHKKQLADLEVLQQSVLKSVKKETQELEMQRQTILQQLGKEKNKLSNMEKELSSLIEPNDLSHVTELDKLKDDNNPWIDMKTTSCHEKIIEEDSDSNSDINCKEDPNSHKNFELEASLNKLALLEQELFKFEGDIMIKNSKTNLNELKSPSLAKSEVIPACNSSLNSVGISEDDKTISTSNSNSVSSCKDSRVPNSITGERQSSGDFDENLREGVSRPMSVTSSSWDEVEANLIVKKRENVQKLQQRPLTRYLPIRNHLFDLKTHIETAGHQIELCPHVMIDSNSCKGYLHKMSKSKHLRTWSKRFFVFDRLKKTFIYYADKSETKAKGGVFFRAIDEVYVDHLNSVKSPQPKKTFCVKTAERTFYMIAPSLEAMRIWVDVIFTGAEGYQEFQQN